MEAGHVFTRRCSERVYALSSFGTDRNYMGKDSRHTYLSTRDFIKVLRDEYQKGILLRVLDLEPVITILLCSFLGSN